MACTPVRREKKALFPTLGFPVRRMRFVHSGAGVPPGAGAGLLAFLSGEVPVELRGRFSSADGTGKVEVEEALVAGISLPPAVVAQIVGQSTRNAKRPQGFDLLSPFPLPFTARRVRLEPGRALVEFFQ